MIISHKSLLEILKEHLVKLFVSLSIIGVLIGIVQTLDIQSLFHSLSLLSDLLSSAFSTP
jgi:hypothetical protein